MADELSPLVRRLRGLLIVGAVLAVAAVALTLRGSGGAPSPPSIVLIIIDTLRADALGVYGATSGSSPNIDRIARSGTVFDRAISAAPWTVPAIASLLTSRYPFEHGEGTSSGEGTVRVTTLAEVLSAHGYATAAFSELSTLLFRRGFDSFETPVGTWRERLMNPERSSAAQTFSAALEWLNQPSLGRPFLLLVHTYEVHDYFLSKASAREAALAANPSYRGRYLDWSVRGEEPHARRLFSDILAAKSDGIAFITGLYNGSLRVVDREVGRLERALEAHGLRDETILVITSDHGEGFSPELARVSHGGRLHDDLLRIPLVFRWPRRLPRTTVGDVVQSIDVTPTLIDMLGLDADARMRGRSLFGKETGVASWLRRGRLVFEPRESPQAYAEESSFEVVWSGRRRVSSRHQFALYSDLLKLVSTHAGPELYDLGSDPQELTNLADQQLQSTVALQRRAADVVGTSKPASSDLDPETLEMLRSLGYLE